MRDGVIGGAVRISLAFAVAVSAAVAPIDIPAAVGARVVAAAGDVQLTASQAIIMTGTDMHTVDDGWVRLAIDDFIVPTLGGRYTGIPLQTPEEFWPFGGLTDALIDDSIVAGGAVLDSAIADALLRQSGSDDPNAPIVVFGYSQSAVIATHLKERLQESVAAGESVPAVNFVMIGNPARPNGGLYSRFEGVQLPGWTMSGATPTDSPFRTIDIARQYDFFADFPQYPANVLAVANAAMGAIYAHGYQSVTLNPDDPRYNPATVVQTYGDTTYYFIPAEHLPLLQPLWDAGVAPEELAAIEPTLRALVELGYDRTIPFGQPTERQESAPVDPAAVRESLSATLRGVPVQRAIESEQKQSPTGARAGRTKAPTANRTIVASRNAAPRR